MYWPLPFANQTSKEVHHAGIESLARTPTANVRNGLRLESHPVSKPLQAHTFSHASTKQTCSPMSLWTPTANVRNGLRLVYPVHTLSHVSSHVSYICHHMSMYWPLPFANQTSKEVHHAGIESLARTPTANVRNGLRLESHPVSKPLQAIRRINQANMFSHVSLTTTTHLSHPIVRHLRRSIMQALRSDTNICHHPVCPCTDCHYTHVQYVRHLRRSIMQALRAIARTPTANVRNGLRLESHPVSKPLQAIQRINQANMFSHVSLPATTLLSHLSYICHHMSMYWPFPCANQTSKEVHHAGIESLARTPTANVRNGLRLESHPVSKPLQAIQRINQANMFSHVSLPTTTLFITCVIHLSSYVHVLTIPMCKSDI